MTGTYIQPGETLDYMNAGETRIEAGTFMFAGIVAAIAATQIEPGETGSIQTEGVFEFKKGAAAIDMGAEVYYDEENDAMTASADNGEEGDSKVSYPRVGVAAAAATAAGTTVRVKLNAF